MTLLADALRYLYVLSPIAEIISRFNIVVGVYAVAPVSGMQRVVFIDRYFEKISICMFGVNLLKACPLSEYPAGIFRKSFQPAPNNMDIVV